MVLKLDGRVRVGDFRLREAEIDLDSYAARPASLVLPSERKAAALYFAGFGVGKAYLQFAVAPGESAWIGIRDIRVTPLPTTLGLLFGPLAGLGWLARRRGRGSSRA